MDGMATKPCRNRSNLPHLLLNEIVATQRCCRDHDPACCKSILLATASTAKKSEYVRRSGVHNHGLLRGGCGCQKNAFAACGVMVSATTLRRYNLIQQ